VALYFPTLLVWAASRCAYYTLPDSIECETITFRFFPEPTKTAKFISKTSYFVLTVLALAVSILRVFLGSHKDEEFRVNEEDRTIEVGDTNMDFTRFRPLLGCLTPSMSMMLATFERPRMVLMAVGLVLDILVCMLCGHYANMVALWVTHQWDCDDFMLNYYLSRLFVYQLFGYLGLAIAAPGLVVRFANTVSRRQIKQQWAGYGGKSVSTFVTRTIQETNTKNSGPGSILPTRQTNIGTKAA
jgi:hypothetical protein